MIMKILLILWNLCALASHIMKHSSSSKSDFSIAFITAIYGTYELSTKSCGCRQNIKTDFICFTNEKSLKNKYGWILDFNPYHTLNPSVLDTGNQLNSLKKNKHYFNIAKYYKQAFHNIPRLKNYDIVVWMDGTLQMKDSNCGMSEWLKRHVSEYKIVGWSHPLRNGSLYAEVADSNFDKYNSPIWRDQAQPIQNVSAQYEAYVKEGYNDNYWNTVRKHVKNTSPEFGVWLTNFVAFDNKNEQVRHFLDLWYQQTLDFSTQDQVSFAYVVQKTGLTPYTLPDKTITGSPYGSNNFYEFIDHFKK
mmetsp:Transcript_30303/g.43333  ORF Transcript_30303/g.43333 Transcript_30303/m.43333 type:complete len:304 (+) Transcript_30303:72-983(+)